MSGVAAPFIPPAGGARTSRRVLADDPDGGQQRAADVAACEAYEQDVFVASTLGRKRFLLNDEEPASITCCSANIDELQTHACDDPHHSADHRRGA